jgi:hypothetical protein
VARSISKTGIAVDHDPVKHRILVLCLATVSACASAHATSPRPAAATQAPGWLGSRSATTTQSAIASIAMPVRFAGSNLLVALVATDGPDTFPATRIMNQTTAVFGGDASLHWNRAAHVSARRDWVAPGGQRELFGASVAEVWTAVPPAQWSPGTVTVTNNHRNAHDDGMAVTIAAFANGVLDHTVVNDGLHDRAEACELVLPDHALVYAATFAGRVNANFVPTPDAHLVTARRAGDDTAGVIATNGHDLPAGQIRIGYTSPNPGDYWEVAAAVVRGAT